MSVASAITTCARVAKATTMSPSLLVTRSKSIMVGNLPSSSSWLPLRFLSAWKCSPLRPYSVGWASTNDDENNTNRLRGRPMEAIDVIGSLRSQAHSLHTHSVTSFPRARPAPGRRSHEVIKEEEPSYEQESNRYEVESKPEGSQLDTLRDKATVRHMAQVYGTATGSVGFAAATSAVTMATGLATAMPMGGLLPALASFVPLIMFMRTDLTSDQNYRKMLLGSFVGLSGMAAAPLITMAAIVNPIAIPMALGGTAAIFLGATGVALLAPRASFLPMGAALGGATMALIGVGIVGIFFPSPLLYNVYLYAGLALFTGFIGYDTQQMIERFRAGDRDYLRHSVDFFIDLLNIFRLLLHMFMSRD
eukprot:m.52359 g.52359  ORF g.52359 m.52359 type:complete len:363 (+) comp10787_c0_seq1:126-1214(+)